MSNEKVKRVMNADLRVGTFVWWMGVWHSVTVFNPTFCEVRNLETQELKFRPAYKGVFVANFDVELPPAEDVEDDGWED
jgi:hypothetical protein